MLARHKFATRNRELFKPMSILCKICQQFPFRGKMTYIVGPVNFSVVYCFVLREIIVNFHICESTSNNRYQIQFDRTSSCLADVGVVHPHFHVYRERICPDRRDMGEWQQLFARNRIEDILLG